MLLEHVENLSLGSHKLVRVKCDFCGREKSVKFYSYIRSTKNGLEKYHCNNKECINAKRKNRLLQKYGVENVFQLDAVKEKIKETNIQKYGVENPQQNEIIKTKTKLTNLQKYGVENVFQSEFIKEKIKKTNLQKYGVGYSQQNKDIRSKNRSYRISFNEKNVLKFIKNNYSGKVTSVTKKLIDGEIDIYMPELHLAIEFNGIYWHNEITKGKNYHKNKSDMCKNIGIQLLHIWEDDWLYKQNIVKSIILNKLNKTPHKIYARKCEIRKITNTTIVKNFLEHNDINGYTRSSINIGLFYNNELVSIMCFKKDKSSGNGYRLVRFCSKVYTVVVGAASKLFNYFVTNFNFNYIKTTVDRSYHTGDIFTKIGFHFDGEILPDYFYTMNNKKKYSKFKKINEKKNLFKIYDAGKYIFTYNK